jgi:uncharacterized protein (TIGR02757 family)
MKKDIHRIRTLLEKLYLKYNRPELIKPDPLQFVYQYTDADDREVVAFFAAALAYGKVEQIEKSLIDMFGRMGESPSAFVRGFDDTGKERLRGFKHRFTTGEDIADMCELLSGALSKYGTLELFFVRGYNQAAQNIIPALSKFCDSLCAVYAGRHGGHVSSGVQYLLASPTRGSASKRLNLFLRWMVRNDAVDPGLWRLVDKAKLIVPVDVHIERLCKILGLYHRKTVSLSAALEITENFARIQPEDPVKYDFALSRIGILEDCNGRYRGRCEVCELFEYCLERKDWGK